MAGHGLFQEPWTEAEVVELLDRSNLAVERGLLAIFDRQTRDEQAAEKAKYVNKVGFSGADVEFGSSMAKRLLGGIHLSEKQLGYARDMVKKYRKQLLSIANGGRIRVE